MAVGNWVTLQCIVLVGLANVAVRSRRIVSYPLLTCRLSFVFSTIRLCRVKICPIS